MDYCEVVTLAYRPCDLVITLVLVSAYTDLAFSDTVVRAVHKLKHMHKLEEWKGIIEKTCFLSTFFQYS